VSAESVLETYARCLERALDAMNRAVEITTAKGPAVAMEFIADFLNDTDGIDEDVADVTPDDWLSRWHVARAEDPS
jgi:predicted ATPase